MSLAMQFSRRYRAESLLNLRISWNRCQVLCALILVRALRDMLQNHVLQVLALVAMEPPVAGRAESVRDRKVDVFRSLSPLGDDDFVLGQYEGYPRGIAVLENT